VTARVFGWLLTWLNDHESDVFFVGTCNDASKLPPEFARAERFDGVFFVDLPSRDQKDAIGAIPVAVTAGDKIEGLRQWASGRCLSADRAGVYSKAEVGSGGRVRQAMRAD